jgi:hypothetical protein
MTENDVFSAVEKEVNANQPESFKLNVDRSGFRHEGNWWYILVQPDQAGIRAYEYDQALRRVEDNVEQHHNIQVLLVPVLPD